MKITIETKRLILIAENGRVLVIDKWGGPTLNLSEQEYIDLCSHALASPR